MEVELSQGKVAIVSPEDYERVNQWSWHFDGRYARGYPHGIKEYLHRYISRPKTGQVVDHINGNKLDCRRDNLRNCSYSVNSSNKHRTINKYGYMGVYFNKKQGKYRSEIYHEGIHYSLGSHNTAEEAHLAYIAAKEQLHS